MANQVMIKIDAGSNVNDEELAEFTMQLKENIKELDVESVDLIKEDKIPKNARTGDVVTWGQLIVDLSPAVIPILIMTLKSYLDRIKPATIRIRDGKGNELEMTGNPSKKQQQMIHKWQSTVMEKSDTNE